MKHETRSLNCIATALIGIFALIGCSDPMKPATTTRVVEVMPDLEDCAASADWLPTTPALEMFQPLPHPATECPFYRGAWQTFMLAMQPDANGKPALLSYPTIDTTFTSRFKHPAHSYLGDIKQAGQREIAIDQNGRSLYYGIHMNEAYRQFIADNDLKTSDKIQAYPTMKANLFFPAGMAEFKSAWQVVEGDAQAIAMQTAGFISMQTTVPLLSQDPNNHAILEDRDHPQNVTVRLLAIHVVFSLPGHPEFIWGSFEHTTGAPDSAAADGKRDVAPFELAHPPKDNKNNAGVTLPASPNNFLLYKGGTPMDEANTSRSEASLHLNATTQKFIDPATQMPESTNIYRMFPASKSNEDVPDEAITSLNHNMEEVFREKGAGDLRGNYRLVGAQWLDKPQYFADNLPLQNNLSSPFAAPTPPGIGNDAFLAAIEADGSDSQYSLLAGEDRMSSTSMESFTQPEGKFPNCFSCHNTQAINSNGVSVDSDATAGAKLLDHGLLNVSHVISQFVLEDCFQPANIVADADNPMIKKAVCPPFVAP